MEGEKGNAGAVAGVKTVKSPIELAREVMEESVHVMLSGEGAEQFAKQQGLEQVDNSYFNTERRYQQLLKAKEKIKASEQSEQQAWEYLDLDYKYGTVGAVAVDKNGLLSAGTSTGGMTAKRYGRIGDSPIIGPALGRTTTVVRYPLLGTVSILFAFTWRQISVRGLSTKACRSVKPATKSFMACWSKQVVPVA